MSRSNIFLSVVVSVAIMGTPLARADDTKQEQRFGTVAAQGKGRAKPIIASNAESRVELVAGRAHSLFRPCKHSGSCRPVVFKRTDDDGQEREYVLIPRCTCNPETREEMRRKADAARANREMLQRAKLERIRGQVELENARAELWIAKQRCKEVRTATLANHQTEPKRQESRRRVPTTQPVEKEFIRPGAPDPVPATCVRVPYYWRTVPYYFGRQIVWIPQRFTYPASQASGGGYSTSSPGYTVTRTIMVRR